MGLYSLSESISKLSILNTLALDFSYNKISQQGVDKLFETIGMLSYLISVDLMLNEVEFPPETMGLLSKSLGGRKKMKVVKLSLRNNFVTDKMVEALSDALC